MRPTTLPDLAQERHAVLAHSLILDIDHHLVEERLQLRRHRRKR